MHINNDIKIAVCFAGHLRTAEYAAENFLRFFGELLPNIDIFIHTWEKNEYKARYRNSLGIKELIEKNNIKLENLDRKFLFEHKPIETFKILNSLKDIFKGRIINYEISNFDPITIKKLHCPVPRFYSWLKVNRLRQQHEKDIGKKYDFIVKTRPDLVVPEDASLIKELEMLIATNNQNIYLYNNDVIYISNAYVMDKLIEPLFDDSINKDELHAYIEHNFFIRRKQTLFSKFAIYRPEYIPNSSLQFDKCNYADYYWHRHITHTHSL